MNDYYIAEFSVTKLWGYKPYHLKFNKDVNILIGPNASGKTTLINILYDALTGNLARLAQTLFDEVIIRLESFGSTEYKTISFRRKDGKLFIKIDQNERVLPLSAFQNPHQIGSSELELHFFIHPLKAEIQDIKTELQGLVPAVWLPVSRRLPITDDEDTPNLFVRRSLESVDDCLSDLLKKLADYRVSLNSDLADLRKEFQRHALENILYDKQHDNNQVFDTGNSLLPTKDDENHLLQAFRDVGFVDREMEKRIHEHFLVAKLAIDKLKDFSKHSKIDLGTLFILPLISRTKSFVKFAQELEDKRAALFDPLDQYKKR